MPMIDDARAAYMSSGDPTLKNYYPAWLKDIAADATVEGSMLDGVVVGAESVRSIVLTIKSLYERQEFRFVGPCGDGFVEDYVAQFNGEPLGCVVLIKFNAAGQTQQVVASYRPRTSVVHFAELLAKKFAGSPIAEHFGSSNR